MAEVEVTICAHCGKSHLSERCPTLFSVHSYAETHRRSRARGQRLAVRASAGARRIVPDRFLRKRSGAPEK